MYILVITSCCFSGPSKKTYVYIHVAAYQPEKSEPQHNKHYIFKDSLNINILTEYSSHSKNTHLDEGILFIWVHLQEPLDTKCPRTGRLHFETLKKHTNLRYMVELSRETTLCHFHFCLNLLNGGQLLKVGSCPNDDNTVQISVSLFPCSI